MFIVSYSLKDYNYHLPKELIAQEACERRDHARLLVLDKKTTDIQHKKFYEILDFLNVGDILVLNNSCVIPARLIGRKKESGGRVEIFLLKEIRDHTWECLVGGRRICEGLEVEFDQNISQMQARICKKNGKTCEVEFLLPQASGNQSSVQKILDFKKKFFKEIEKIGQTPLPPYIKKYSKEDKQRYQTVYADQVQKGSVAAPTAGLHFTKDLLNKIQKKGVRIRYVTLHVGLGTFASVESDDIRKHQMHEEFFGIEKSLIYEIEEAKKNQQKIIAVGTTSTRTLESVFANLEKYLKQDGKYIYGSTDIFIYPGFRFRVVDSLITNFHLPCSTLLMLVSALAGRGLIKKAYEEAILEKYRFYSYGDAMFIF